MSYGKVDDKVAICIVVALWIFSMVGQEREHLPYWVGKLLDYHVYHRRYLIAAYRLIESETQHCKMIPMTPCDIVHCPGSWHTT